MLLGSGTTVGSIERRHVALAPRGAIQLCSGCNNEDLGCRERCGVAAAAPIETHAAAGE